MRKTPSRNRVSMLAAALLATALSVFCAPTSLADYTEPLLVLNSVGRNACDAYQRGDMPRYEQLCKMIQTARRVCPAFKITRYDSRVASSLQTQYGEIKRCFAERRYGDAEQAYICAIAILDQTSQLPMVKQMGKNYADLLIQLKRPDEARHLTSALNGSSNEGGFGPNFGPYVADLERRIKKHWAPPRQNTSAKTEVYFEVATDGTLNGVRLRTSSGSTPLDQASLQAIEDAAPFRSLPQGSPPFVDVAFTFDYRVHNSVLRY